MSSRERSPSLDPMKESLLPILQRYRVCRFLISTDGMERNRTEKELC